jgi:hypothetical protein
MLRFTSKIGDIYFSNISKQIYDPLDKEWFGFTNGILIYYHPETEEYQKKVFKILLINSSHTQAVVSTFQMKKFKFAMSERYLKYTEFVLVE